jgi:hypothetical protein
MPFIIGILFLFKPYLLLLISFFTNLFLFDIKRDNNILIHNLLNRLKQYINRLKNFLNELIENKFLHTLGGKPEQSKIGLDKPNNINLKTSGGEPSGVPRAVGTDSDLYNSGGNSPVASVSDPVAENSGVGSDISPSNNDLPTNT